MSQIPITTEYANAVGEWCERVENRSLLHEKFAFPKNWGDDNKENQASNWSLMRIASNGSALLKTKADDLVRKANGQNVESEEKRIRLKNEAQYCRLLANAQIGSNLEVIRPKHTVRFLELLRANYSEGRVFIVEVRLEGRLAINLAEGMIQNGGMSLDRIFGLPLIPGSAVKGVTRHTAMEALKNNPGLLETFVRVFGVAESDWKGDLVAFASKRKDLKLPLELKGAVTFLQATPTNDANIVVDITNVHFPNYYQGNEDNAKTERPIPNYFPAVEVGAEFAFPLLLNSMSNDTALLDAAKQWLSVALQSRGIGAKTAAGYGWFKDLGAEKEAIARAKQQAIEQAEADQRAQEEATAAEALRIAALTPDQKIGEAKTALAALPDEPFADKVKAIATLPEHEQRALIRLFAEDKAKRERLKTWRKKKPDNVKALDQIATTLKEPLP